MAVAELAPFLARRSFSTRLAQTLVVIALFLFVVAVFVG
jgi:hypothetical protein